eukprot:snap_masked-scaffold_2-processed-gene-1.21-mRNA-1 protein AED:1.00 eAED:1.00 QI:0/-1/0/0/-1/1/1/0/363
MALNNDSALEQLKLEKTNGSSSNGNLLQTEASTKSFAQLGKPNAKTKKKRPGKKSAAAALRQSARRVGGSNFRLQALQLAAKQADQEKNKSKKSISQPTNTTLKKGKPSKSLINRRSMMNTAPSPSMLGAPMPEELGVTKKMTSRGRGLSRDSKKSERSEGKKPTKAASQRENIIRYGELLKKSVTLSKTWKQRFVVVTNKAVYYYETSFDVPQEFSQIDIKPRGCIPFDTVNNCTADNQDPNHQKFIIYTADRVYRFQADFSGGASVWVGLIMGAVENSMQQFNGLTRGYSSRRESFSSLIADEVDSFNLTEGRASSVFGFRNLTEALDHDAAKKSKAWGNENQKSGRLTVADAQEDNEFNI